MFEVGYNPLKSRERLEAEIWLLKNRPPVRAAYKIDREKPPKQHYENPCDTNKEAAAFLPGVSGIRRAKKLLGVTRQKTSSALKKS